MLVSTIKFFVNLSSLLSSLITLELIALSTYFLISSFTNFSPIESYRTLVFLTIAVCDGVLGISILLLTSPSRGDGSIIFLDTTK